MATVTPLQGSTGFADRGPDGEGALLPRPYLVSGLAISEDATALGGIPQPGSQFTLGDFTYTCDRVKVAQVFSDNSCRVEALYSTDGRFQPTPFSGVDTLHPDYQGWDIGYRKSKYEIPRFTKGQRTYATSPGGPIAAQDYWQYTPISIDLEYMTFNRVLNLFPVLPSEVLGIVSLIHAQVGHIHVFPGLPTVKWQMNSPTIRNNKLNQLQVAYAWESDPGNDIIDVIDPARFIVPAVQRLPFHVYQVTAATVAQPNPQIFAQNLFPNSSSRNTPLGWQTLPGHPI